MSDPRKRVHTLLTDGAVAGLSAREVDELDALLDGEPIDPSYEHAAAAIELGLLDHTEPMPAALEAMVVEQANRYWGFAELRPREPTLGGTGGEIMLGAEAEAVVVQRQWDRSDELVLESSLTNGRIDRLGPSESMRGEILPAAIGEPDERVDTAEIERRERFDSEVDASLGALEQPPRDDDDFDLDDDDEIDDEIDEPEPTTVGAKRKRKRSEPAPEASELIPMSRDYRVARWATYVSAVAALVILAVALWLFAHRDDTPDPEELEASIEDQGDKLEWSFEAKPDEFVGEGAGGSVVWSSELQAGVMTLRGLANNDPTAAQYQLWIHDGKREGPPVDGGVFDIPPNVDEVQIPVDAKLLVGEPVMFVITIEQPGGAVVSKQDRVAMVSAGE